MQHPAGLPADLAVLDRTLVMGILNVTPDSFSDGGLYFDHADAVAHGLAMVDAGADLIDVGGESTRPGARPVDSDEERDRVLGVVRDLVAQGVLVSIDTRHADVARACVEAGAVLVNDVSAGRGDPAMWPFVSAAKVPYVLMHNRGEGIARPDLAGYGSSESGGASSGSTPVWQELAERCGEALAAGISPDHLIVDPGIGFAKDARLSWLLAAEDPRTSWASLAAEPAAAPVLLGVSRKRFLATHSDGSAREDDSMAQRDRLTLQITERAASRGVWCVRVHDVAPNAEAVRRVAATARMDP
jgi:dihydropteroate synthase